MTRLDPTATGLRKYLYFLSLGFIFMIPWEGAIRFGGTHNAAKLLGVLLAVLWVATVVLTERFRRPRSFHIVFCLFVLWNAVSVFWSADQKEALARVTTWAQLLGMVIILWDLYTTRSALLTGLQMYVLGAYVAVGNALGNYFSGNVYYSHYQRFSSDGINPDGFGITLSLGIPVAWYLASSSGNGRLGHWLKIINYGYIPAALIGIALSGTRTAFIAAIPGMLFGLASLTRIRPAARVATLVLLTVAFLLLLPRLQTMRSFQRLGTTGSELVEGDLNNRTNNWVEGLSSFTDHPLLGVGTNNYRAVNTRGKLAHNSFISILVELGLIGFSLFGIILAIAVVEAWVQPKWDARFWLTTLFVWSLGASTLSWEFRKPTWLFLSMLVVSAAAVERDGNDRKAVLVRG